ncbi:LPXTG cell wall anchor domain-containing protein [Gulosibacter macacae]|uniref:LPXTG cell wall anchor domain-containing protein n=1 Tax=Gulosibacter macacae TaxID=2488791 RepID=A0A3P3VX57_9MICO|nr:LPXTG cell wall anchor domain-containing protein [Gulosibacter macacae]RRJ86628.1 LPXTG cell wall anchor domain-containing protein [Gulosibacter macacae]
MEHAIAVLADSLAAELATTGANNFGLIVGIGAGLLALGAIVLLLRRRSADRSQSGGSDAGGATAASGTGADSKADRTDLDGGDGGDGGGGGD